jgi:hypothetical protein
MLEEALAFISKNMRMQGLPEPVFSDTRGSFSVKLFNGSSTEPVMLDGQEPDLVNFCRIPRRRQEIAAYLNLGSVTYAIKRHALPLVEKGFLAMTIPEKPTSAHPLFVTVWANS